MNPLTTTFLINAALAFIAMTLLWLISLPLRDVSIVDPFWGPGFAVVAWSSLFLNGPILWRPLLLAVLTTLWALRLAIYLLWRNWGHAEDRRYAAMREKAGSKFWWQSLLVVFWLQAALMWLVSLPIQVAAVSNAASGAAGLTAFDIVGLLLWLVGLTFESVGDWQLARFRADKSNVGKVLDRGLWRYTRHPNYFGDFCVWWGLFAIAAAGGAALTFISPLVMSVLLMRVSGVTLLEQTMTDRRPDYAAYIRRTSAFFPFPPATR